jgi:hypothetical protein
VIEHNLEVVKTADWVIDLGPEGGDKGGHIVAVGTPETVSETKGSYTGEYLAEIFKRGKRARQPAADLLDHADIEPPAKKTRKSTTKKKTAAKKGVAKGSAKKKAGSAKPPRKRAAAARATPTKRKRRKA